MIGGDTSDWFTAGRANGLVVFHDTLTRHPLLSFLSTAFHESTDRDEAGKPVTDVAGAPGRELQGRDYANRCRGIEMH